MDFTSPPFKEKEEVKRPMLPGPGQIHESDPKVLSLKLQMTQASMCHEYARMEYDKTLCVMRRGQLEEEMALYHQDYQEARESLYRRDPNLSETLEGDLTLQKQLVFSRYQA